MTDPWCWYICQHDWGIYIYINGIHGTPYMAPWTLWVTGFSHPRMIQMSSKLAGQLEKLQLKGDIGDILRDPATRPVFWLGELESDPVN